MIDVNNDAIILIIIYLFNVKYNMATSPVTYIVGYHIGGRTHSQQLRSEMCAFLRTFALAVMPGPLPCWLLSGSAQMAPSMLILVLSVLPFFFFIALSTI